MLQSGMIMPREDSKIFIVEPVSRDTSIEYARSVAEGRKRIKKLDRLRKLISKPKGRKKSFKMIAETFDNTSFPFVDGLYGPLALVISILSSFWTTLLPVHNVLINPNYWYEILFSSVAFVFLVASFVAVRSEAVLKPFNKRTFSIIFHLFVAYKGTEILAHCGVHLIWSKLIGYFEPFPFRCALVNLPSYIVMMIRLWYLFSKDKRMDPIFRKRSSAFLSYIFWSIFVTMQLNVITKLFNKVSREVQWLAGLIVPVTKEINDRIIDRFITKSALPENIVEASFIGKISNNLAYSFWLAITLATSATEVTGFVLLGINFCLNLLICFRALKLTRKVSPPPFNTVAKKDLRDKVVTELILNESIEILVPIAFIGSFSAAYFGPNNDTLGGVGCSVWTYHKVDDLYDLFLPVLEMAIFDSGSLIISGCLLWNFCRINIIRKYCKTIKKFWIYLAIGSGYYINAVCVTRIIS